MALADIFSFLMRVAHLGALTALLGSGLFFAVTRSTLRPALGPEDWAAYRRKLRLLTRPSFAVLIVSGVYLVFYRLADPRVGLWYILVLAAKVLLVVAIAWLTSLRGPPRSAAPPKWRDPSLLALLLGAGALVLGVLLTAIYEADTAGAGVP